MDHPFDSDFHSLIPETFSGREAAGDDAKH
jgi:hypothetical protein